MEFGQIPKQLFNVPHPQRRSALQLVTEPSDIIPEQKLEGKIQDCLQKFATLVIYVKLLKEIL